MYPSQNLKRCEDVACLERLKRVSTCLVVKRMKYLSQVEHSEKSAFQLHPSRHFAYHIFISHFIVDIFEPAEWQDICRIST